MRLYEINSRVHCPTFYDLGNSELDELSSLGFDAIWLMGIWKISEASKRISRIISEDFFGSPFAVPAYQVSRQMGGKSALLSLVDRAHTAGLPVIVDFVSNHMAIDSPWIKERADFFIRGNPRVRPQNTSDFFLHESGEVIAFGRDPFFPPWHDTAQLDYTHEGLRSRMIEVLKWISRLVDGVRCDMAMLLLRDYLRQQWYPFPPQAWFDDKMPDEFWDHAIGEVRRLSPEFYFVAETYWDKEKNLLDLGFDLAYEKKLYDGLVGRDLSLVLNRVSRPFRELSGSLYFIENHDEQRAARVFSREENLAALALILSLPGSVLIHEGQMEGRREHLPVQRLRPATEEPVDETLRTEYVKLLRLTNADVFKEGSFLLFDPGARGALGFLRQDKERNVAYLGQIADSPDFAFSTVDLTSISKAVSATSRLRVVNLLNSRSVVLQTLDGTFRCLPSELGVEDKAMFCVIEMTPC